MSARRALAVLALTLAPVACRHAPDEGAPTFVDDVAPLLARHCVDCHHEGGSAPFALRDYDDARRKAGPLRAVTQSGAMPPWKPTAGADVFHDARGLTPDEVDVFARWHAAGAPPGDRDGFEPPPPPSDEWQLGEPDVVLRMETPFEVPADGGELWRSFAVATGFERDRWLTGVEFRHANAKPVHHVILWVDADGSLRRLGGEDAGPGSLVAVEQAAPGRIVGGWIPGNSPRRFPDGTAALLPAGADLVFEHHFVTTGRPETIVTAVGLHLAKEPPARPLEVLQLTGGALHIPPGEAAYVRRAEYVLPRPITLVALTPHAHYVCRSIEVTARPPGGGAEPLIAVSDWDPAWQATYTYREPRRLPAGTVIELAYTFDNSEANPRNPHAPPRRVILGERSDQEMSELFAHVCLDRAEDLAPLVAMVEDAVRERWNPGDEHLVWRALTEQFDADGDGSLDAAEDAAASALVDTIRERPDLLLQIADADGDGALDASEDAEVERLIGVWRGAGN